MEVSDGFILGIYNYCDRWCERCRLTNRCLVFSDRAEIEFERDHGPIGEPRAERMAHQIGESMARWEKELGIDFEAVHLEAVEELKNSPDPDAAFEVSLEHLELETRARDFTDAVWKWLEPIPDLQYRASEPVQVLGHFWIFVSGKVHRALMGLKDGQLDDQSDALGSAKAALLGLEEMRAACHALAETDLMSEQTSLDLVERIDWLTLNLDSTVPQARAFVRPGFDEPEKIARLEKDEVGGAEESK